MSRFAPLSSKEDIFLGFDPGGSDNFGVALVAGAENETGVVSSVSAAFTWAVERCGQAIPRAAGVDTLLHWSDGPGGWRSAEKKLRSSYPRAKNSVISPNGLFGSMAIGGMALAILLRQQWQDIYLNETHPKLLVHALGGARYSDSNAAGAITWLSEQSGLDLGRIANGHELDALLSAWATREGLNAGWNDISKEGCGHILPAGTVHYLWPQQLQAAKI